MILVAMLVAGTLAGPSGDSRDSGSCREAFAALRQGKPSVAGKKAKEVIDREGPNAEAYGILGDVFVAGAKFSDALDAYQRALELRGGSDPGTLKKIAAVQEWTRGFTQADETLRSVLRVNQEDEEARSMRNGIALRRSLHLFGSAGGTEVDYARNVQEAGAFIGWFDRMDLYGGISRTDRIFYRRTSIWSDAYLFPGGGWTLRAGIRMKRYEYPVELNPRPDNSAYARSTHFQIEGSHDFGGGNSLSLELEYFRPEMYWNTGLRANNIKVSAGLRSTIIGEIYGKLFAAMLRDPDPDSFVMEAATGTALGFGYETVTLVGGGVGYDGGDFAGEVMYVPDRDLDRSLEWSVFAKVRYMPGRFGVQADLLLDRYPAIGTREVTASRVVMISVLANPWDALEVRAGWKALTRLTTESAPFVTLRIKTGL